MCIKYFKGEFSFLSKHLHEYKYTITLFCYRLNSPEVNKWTEDLNTPEEYTSKSRKIVVLKYKSHLMSFSLWKKLCEDFLEDTCVCEREYVVYSNFTHRQFRTSWQSEPVCYCILVPAILFIVAFLLVASYNQESD